MRGRRDPFVFPLEEKVRMGGLEVRLMACDPEQGMCGGKMGATKESFQDLTRDIT